ncbi:hypothetical protein MNBD_PLANCTO03-771 [hydrothermal vent metagenome]|uniref:Uncharacterized protein n=1 Tax=hydrothermal vent metagenome TaxID=652676 RepID=A0A3B1E2P4_9ZZZZ
MERDKLIKIIVAAVIGLAAIVILAINFLGGGPPKPAETPVLAPEDRPPVRGSVPDG